MIYNQYFNAKCYRMRRTLDGFVIFCWASSWVAGLSSSFLFRSADKLAPCAFQKHAMNESVYRIFIHSAISCCSVLLLMNFSLCCVAVPQHREGELFIFFFTFSSILQPIEYLLILPPYYISFALLLVIQCHYFVVLSFLFFFYSNPIF